MASVDISQEELSSFHASHFSIESVANFVQEFLGPVEEEAQEEDDGLGYYDDGVKRTLTDEQIQIFRHSEIETLLRERRHAAEAKEFSSHDATPAIMDERDVEDGELENMNTPPMIGPIAPPTTSQNPTGKKKKKNKNKSQRQRQRDPVDKGFFRANVKPDLRKRTWDKAETGLEDLQYDDMDGDTAAAPSHAPQRRKISYDDD